MNEGNRVAALEVVTALLRDDPYDIEAWRLAVALGRTEEERNHAQQQLERALQHAADKAAVNAPAAQLQSSNTVADPPLPTQPPTRDYFFYAVALLGLYYLGGGVPGLVVNLLFLYIAREDRRKGVQQQNVGCLQAMLIFNLGALAVSICVFTVFVLFYGFSTVLSVCGGFAFLVFGILAEAMALEQGPTG